jgi:isopentenyl diphosphate isomerase/L-lactate dehydrogenase-like FMN-dependent dehydrogenase
VPAAAARRPPRLVPRADLVNVLEYEAEAAKVLSPALRARVTGSDRTAFDRITLRPRMLSPTVNLDLSVTLFDESLFAPIIAGPMTGAAEFHADGDAALIRGASAARTVSIVASTSRMPIADVLAQATSPVWFQVSADDRAAAIGLRAAVEAGCKVGFVTLATAADGLASRLTRPTNAQWSAVESLARSAAVPLVVKGITSVDDAARAIERGAKGLVVSGYGQPVAAGQPLLLALPAIVDAVAGRVPVLVDGGFRRGTDVLKALAFGARGVLVGRPLFWGLAAYGAEGVQGVLEMLRTELARYMAMCGTTTVASLSRAVLKVHSAMPDVKPGQGRS